MKFTGFICLIILFASCSTTEKTEEKNTSDSIDTLSVIPGDCDSLFIVDTELYDHFFGFPASLQNFRKQLGANFQHRKEATENIHIEEQFDTIDHISYGTSNVKIYRMPDKNILFQAYIGSNDLLKASSFKIGMTKTEFWKITGISPVSCDSIPVGDEEGLISFSFVFTDSLLNHVRFEGYLD